MVLLPLTVLETTRHAPSTPSALAPAAPAPAVDPDAEFECYEAFTVLLR